MMVEANESNNAVAIATYFSLAEPRITSIGGVTASATGVYNEVVDMPSGLGDAWDGLRMVNDQRGLYTWTVNGSNFGTTLGKANLTGCEEPVLRWTSTSITIDPSGTQINPTRPWDWGTRLVIRTAAGQETTQGVGIVPAVRSRPYRQCTWWVAVRRLQMGLAPSSSAYGGQSSITANSNPRVGDQLKWGTNSHTANPGSRAEA